VCATNFIIAAVRHVKIGDLSNQPGLSLAGDAPPDAVTVIDSESTVPVGNEMGYASVLSKSEERALVRDSTAGFAGDSFQLTVIGITLTA
jgi:proteasome activator subunit 4